MIKVSSPYGSAYIKPDGSVDIFSADISLICTLSKDCAKDTETLEAIMKAYNKGNLIGFKLGATLTQASKLPARPRISHAH